jgi:flagellar protein FlaF
LSLAHYRNTAQRTDTPRETEIRVFAHVNALLAGAGSAAARVAALHTNHKLWSVLLMDLASPTNRLPRELRGRLASLAIWVQRESMRLMDSTDPLDALIGINRDMADGLAAQRDAAAQPAPPAQTFAPAVA